MSDPPRPDWSTLREYGASLGSVAYWAPYVGHVLRRHGLPDVELEAGFVGSFPTFIAGDHVVKLFGEWLDGGQCHRIESDLARLFAGHPGIPAPALIASGQLFNEGWPWPYVVTTRMPGTAWRDACLTFDQRLRVAAEVGEIMRQVHLLTPPSDVWRPDWLADGRAACVGRHRRWKSLPSHLIDQIDDYLLDPLPVRRLVHGDLTADHLFVDRGRLAGIIDWGDAMHVDPFYELPALHLHTFGCDGRLLKAFVDGSGWETLAEFPRRAMTATLLHKFDVLSGAGGIEMARMATLDELAGVLWDLG